jgi:hypothetical protein
MESWFGADIMHPAVFKTRAVCTEGRVGQPGGDGAGQTGASRGRGPLDASLGAMSRLTVQEEPLSARSARSRMT